MRTTLDLPDDLHAVVREIAHDRRDSMSQVAADLMRRALETGKGNTPRIGPRGLPIITVGHPVTTEDVSSLEDD